MTTMHIAFVLELYQPPYQSQEMLERITNECYVPLARLLEAERFPITLSFTQSLIERLDAFGLLDSVRPAIQYGVERGDIELVHSGAYHSVFPLLSDREVNRQIQLDMETKGTWFGPTEARGILPPELCYKDGLLPLFRSLGFTWTLVNDKIMQGFGIKVPDSEVYDAEGLAVLLRSSLWSDGIREHKTEGGHWTGRDFSREMAYEVERLGRDAYKVIMLPGETFGHHVPYFQETFLRDLLYALADCQSVRLDTVSGLLDSGRFRRVEITPRGSSEFQFLPPSSVSTHWEDLERGDPYPHFRSCGNSVHEGLWQLTSLIMEATGRLDFARPDFQRLRRLLDSAFYSGQYYHASLWFWDSGPILEGVDRQMRALYEYARATEDFKALHAGQEIYTNLLWEVHCRNQAKAAN